MKRPFNVLMLGITAVVVLAGVSAFAAHKIKLVSGQVITADDKPVIKEGMAYFSKGGLQCYLPASKIAPEGEAAAPDTAAVQPAPQAPRKVGEEQLDEIRKRVRLANEDELVPTAPSEPAAVEEGGEPVAEPEAKGGEASKSADQADLRTQALERLSGLNQSRNSIQQRQEQLQSQYSSVKEQFDYATQFAEKQSLGSQLDSLQGQLSQSRSDLSSMDSQIQAAQQEIATMPVVVELQPQER